MGWYYTSLPLRSLWQKGGTATYMLTIYLTSHILLSSSIQKTRQLVLSRARSCCFSGGSSKGRRWGHRLSLAAVDSFLVLLHASSSVGGRRRLRLWNQSNTVGKPPIVFLHVPAEMHQPWHRSHSNTKMGAPCFLWLYIHQQRGRSLSRVWGDNSASCSGICSPHILIFLTAEKFVLIHGGSWMLSKMLFQSPLPVEDFIQSVQALVSVFSSNLPTSWRGLELAGMISS